MISIDSLLHAKWRKQNINYWSTCSVRFCYYTHEETDDLCISSIDCKILKKKNLRTIMFQFFLRS